MKKTMQQTTRTEHSAKVVEVGAFTRAEREASGFEERLSAYCSEVGYTTDRRDMFWRMEQDGRLVLFRRGGE